MCPVIPYTYLTDHVGDFCVLYETPGFDSNKDEVKQHQLQVVIGLSRKLRKSILSSCIELSERLLIKIHSQLHRDEATLERWVQFHKVDFEALAEKALEAKIRRLGEAGAMDFVPEEETLYHEWLSSKDEPDDFNSMESGKGPQTPPDTASSTGRSETPNSDH